MFVEDKIIRTARNTIGSAFQTFANKVQLDTYLEYDDLYTIIDALCSFYDGNSSLIFKLPAEYRDEVLEALTRRGICLTKNSYRSLRTMVRKVLSQRYRSPFDRISKGGDGVSLPVEMPQHITAFAVCGSFSFEDFVCLNNYDADRLKQELEKLASKHSLSPTLSLILEQMEKPDLPLGRLPYDCLPYSPSMRPYQRLRMLDEVLVEADEALTLTTINSRLREKAEANGIDIDTLWRKHSSSNGESELEDLYEKDFMALAEMIAIDPSHVNGTKRDLVYDFSIKGKRKYREPEFSAFKLVLTAKEAEQIYKENPKYSIKKMERLAHYPMLCALAIYGKNHSSDSGTICNSQPMEYAGYNLLDYYPETDDYLMQKAEEIILSKQLLAVRQGKGEWYPYIPLEIRQRNGEWRLIVFDYKYKEFNSLSPSILKKGIASLPEKSKFIYYPELLIGLAAPFYDMPIRIKIEMDFSTAKKFLKDPAYDAMNLRSEPESMWDLTDPFPGTSLFDEPQEDTRLFTLNFFIYPNIDFFNDLYQYSESGHLKIQYPSKIQKKYEDYCRHRSVIRE